MLFFVSFLKKFVRIWKSKHLWENFGAVKKLVFQWKGVSTELGDAIADVGMAVSFHNNFQLEKVFVPCWNESKMF